MSNYTAEDVSRSVVISNFERIKMLAVAGTLLCKPQETARIMQLVHNRSRWGLPPLALMLATHNAAERSAAQRFLSDTSGEVAGSVIVHQAKHTEIVGNAIDAFRELIDPNADAFGAKRQILCLTRRGGKGKPKFISPFTGGQGTTCGEWTRPMVRHKDGTVTKGFMKASLAVGFCPVACPFCYLQMRFTDGMDIALNWEDLQSELLKRWRGYQYPINFGETSGLVEYDEWFVDDDGSGSMIQYVIDACAAADVIPFFLTKIRYPRYLQFNGHVQVGISLMPEAVRSWMAPYGSPSIELLESLAWAARSGARDPVIRMTAVWQQIEEYPDLLRKCRDLLGTSGWRLTLDILRFTPSTATTIANRYPEAAKAFARELTDGDSESLYELGRRALSSDEHIKKIRPSEERQADIYRWFRRELDALGCSAVMMTPCKGDPDELVPLVREGTLRAMPCACFNIGNCHKAEVVPLEDLQRSQLRLSEVKAACGATAVPI